MTAPRHAAIVLAAGASRRFGAPKQLLLRDGETWVHRTARLALATQPLEALIVLGAKADSIGDSVADLAVRTVFCDDADLGMGASLAAALQAVSPECEGALVLLCDQPALDAPHLDALLARWRARPDHAVASAYAGVIGVPAVLPRAWFCLLDGGSDRGARELLRDQPNVIAVACDALSRDVDTPADLEATVWPP